MCGGVLIAQEMILQLESEGEEVALFTIFDTWVLENSQIRPLWAVNYYLDRFQNLRALPLNEQLATVRRVFERITAPGNANPKSGWSGAFWPGKDFQPPRFRAPVLLFKRPRQPYFYIRDPQMGWGSRSTGGVETFEIRCGHVEMLREPYVRLVGQTLGNRLQAIEHQEKTQLPISGSPTDLRSDHDSGTWVSSVA
jgi:thioesterase domain-containing protein